ncbi:MAG: DeoR/GlpR family DNA-binding transcription regulator [Pseudomonadota bacterium]
MAQQSRHEKILDLVNRQGFATIEELAQAFGVTPQTVRRDLNVLHEQALLRRYHGGAGSLGSSTANTAYQQRQVQNADEKRRIAEAVANHIPDHASLFINIGTTNDAIAHALLATRRGLKVITNNLHVANTLGPREDFEVIIAGGQVRSSDGGIIGEATLDLVGQFKVDFALVGTSGIDEDGTLLDFDYHEVRVSQAMIANARRVYLAADHSKFGRKAMIRLGSLDDVHSLFTDTDPPASIVEVLARARRRLVIAGRDLPDSGD